MPYLCEFGHRNVDGTPKRHPSRQFCDLAKASDKKRGRSTTARSVDVSTAPSEATPGTAPATPPAPKKPMLGERLGIKSKVSATIQPHPPEGPGVAAQVEWELTEQQSERLWSTIYSGIFRITNLVLDWLDVKQFPASITEPDEGQKYVFRTTLRGPATGMVQKVFRAKTPEEADNVIMGLSGLFTFGTTIVQVVVHLSKEVPKSPKIKAWREKLAARRKEGGGRGRSVQEEREPGPATPFVPITAPSGRLAGAPA